MLLLTLLSQELELEEEIKATRTRFYNIDGNIGFWASDNQYYRGELGVQMQFDIGVYGRFSIISFDRFYPYVSPYVRLKESFIEFAFANSLDIRGGLGPLYWENGLTFGDYLGGIPFLGISYGRNVWLDFVLALPFDKMVSGLRASLDFGIFSLTGYGIYDTSGTVYGGISSNLNFGIFDFNAEGVGTNERDGAIYLSTDLEIGRFSMGLHGFSTTEGYERIVGQGIVFDEERSGFFGFSTYLTYSMYEIPWTNITGRSGEFLRLSLLWPINEDWIAKPYLDMGMYQEKPLDMQKRNRYFADANIRLDWAETIYLGASGGIYLNEKVDWKVAVYAVSTFSF